MCLIDNIFSGGWVEFGIGVGIEAMARSHRIVVEISVFGDSVVLRCFGNGSGEMSWRGMIFGLVIVVTPSTLSHSPNTDQILGLW